MQFSFLFKFMTYAKKELRKNINKYKERGMPKESPCCHSIYNFLEYSLKHYTGKQLKTVNSQTSIMHN